MRTFTFGGAAARDEPVGERPARPGSYAGRSRRVVHADGAGSGHDPVRLLQAGTDRGADLLRVRLWRHRRAAAGLRAPAFCSPPISWSAAAGPFRSRKKPTRLWPKDQRWSGWWCGATRAATSRGPGGRDIWWHDFMAGPAGRMRAHAARFGNARAAALHVRNHRPSEGGRPHARGRAGADRQGNPPDVRPSRGRPLLVGDPTSAG